MGISTLCHRIYATCTGHVHMHAFVYELAYRYKPTLHCTADVTALRMQHKHGAAKTNMPNMCSFVEVTTRSMGGEGFD